MKKLALIILSSLLLFNSLALPLTALAQDPPADPATPTTSTTSTGSWYNQNFNDWYSKVYDGKNPSEIFGERYTAAQVQWIIYSLFAFLINTASSAELVSCITTAGTDLTNCSQYLNQSTPTSENKELLNLTKQSEVSKNLSQLVFTRRSFSGIYYIQDMFQKYSIVPSTYAQDGFGFNALDIVKDMWSTSRDIAFGLFVLACIIMAFMIMFRVKISPQVVISVQSSIPKLISALILVTFSYAIAGLLVDLMYVVYAILGLILKDFMPFFKPTSEAMFKFFTGGQLLGIPLDLGVIGLVVVYTILFLLCFIITLFTTLGLLQSLLAAGVTLIAAFLTPLSTYMIFIGIALIIIVIVFLIINTIKIIFSLLKAYLNILLLTIFAPIQILMGILMPNFGFGAWFKSYISNLAIFIVTSVLFYFAFIFLLIGTKTGLDAVAGAGPFIDFVFKLVLGSALTSGVHAINSPSNWPPLIGGANGSLGLLLIGVSFVIFTIIPKANELIQSFIAGKPFSYGNAIGEAVKLPLQFGQGYLSGRVADFEEGRRRTPGVTEDTKTTHLLNALGLIRRK